MHDSTPVKDKKKVGEEIVAAAKRHGADFIVTGSHGLSGVKKVRVKAPAKFFLSSAVSAIA